MDMCHEMSQYKPTDVAVTATAEAQMYHGIPCAWYGVGSNAMPFAMFSSLLSYVAARGVGAVAAHSTTAFGRQSSLLS
jgi:hypothetical protein